jgi:hypothetical protein
MSAEGGPDTAIWLTRIEGKLDLSNLRHDQTDARLNTIDQRLHNHGNQITNLMASEHQRKGAAVAIKVMWALGGSGVVGLIALVARSFQL